MLEGREMIAHPLGTRLKKTAYAFALALGGFALVATPAAAQVERFDPDEAYEMSRQSDAIDADLTGAGSTSAAASAPSAPATNSSPTIAPPLGESGDRAGSAQSNEGDEAYANGYTFHSAEDPSAQVAAPEASATASAAAHSDTYGEDDLIGAAEGVFGKGAEGLARMIQKLLKEQGEPNGYIVGREAGGAFILGARYGSGTLFHKIEGERKVYWTGPSIGLDAGANAANTFVLVYNLFDSEDLFTRYPAGEGQAYLIGGLHASYMRKGDVVLIPVRMGAGVRLGINAGYMKFSKKQRWLPF
jgi:hypothetical protein